MPFYNNSFLKDNPFVIDRLLSLRQGLYKNIPTRNLRDSLLLASWNIRDFDTKAYGYRGDEPLHYIAEIISHFDLVAVQEVNRDLQALKKVVKLLGGDWKYIFTDTTEGNAGNDERLAFLYDSRKVRFAGLAGEIVIPPLKVDGDTVPSAQIVRTPYLAGFRAGWTDFILTTVHILYGSSSSTDPVRKAEIISLAKFLANRANDKKSWSRNIVMLGDFNIFQRNDEVYEALLEHSTFYIPDELQTIPGSNVPQNKFYDQIAFKGKFKLYDAGVFDFYEYVYRLEDEQHYVADMGDAYHTTSSGNPRENKTLYYKTYWRTHQMSDHLPMWVELGINNTDDYLNSLKG